MAWNCSNWLVLPIAPASALGTSPSEISESWKSPGPWRRIHASLLLDEPASGLGPSDTKELGDLILRLRDRGVTVLFIEHDMNLVMKIAEKVIVIDFGIKIAEGTPDEIQNNVDVLLAYLGTGAAPQTRVEPT